ncbi:hypothetical protein JOB18_019135 [Solea senegalensis]|uniref:Uncharacterized protein n=1 Tax=Solea senegalensis TaxID=28829 RepID=A0AAV6T672_SOLSE|nr:hypothetical protein JOB18_019135 [Solea senegalensis]
MSSGNGYTSQSLIYSAVDQLACKITADLCCHPSGAGSLGPCSVLSNAANECEETRQQGSVCSELIVSTLKERPRPAVVPPRTRRCGTPPIADKVTICSRVLLLIRECTSVDRDPDSGK